MRVATSSSQVTQFPRETCPLSRASGATLRAPQTLGVARRAAVHRRGGASLPEIRRKGRRSLCSGLRGWIYSKLKPLHSQQRAVSHRCREDRTRPARCSMDRRAGSEIFVSTSWPTVVRSMPTCGGRWKRRRGISVSGALLAQTHIQGPVVRQPTQKCTTLLLAHRDPTVLLRLNVPTAWSDGGDRENVEEHAISFAPTSANRFCFLPRHLRKLVLSHGQLRARTPEPATDL